MNLQDMFGLDGRIALVTGGSRGIGKMIVEGFLAAGCARVYISARKTAQIEAAVADFETRYPGKVVGLPVDLATVEGCRSLAKELEAREQRLDILVNNAGAAWGEPFDTFPESGWDKVMDINVKSPFFLTQALHTLLKAGGSPERPAKVINIGSIDGIRLNPWETYSYHAAGRGPYPRHRDRTGRVRVGYEQGRARPWRRRRSDHPDQAHRRAGGHGGRRHLPRVEGGRLCRRRHDRGRRRAGLRPSGQQHRRLIPPSPPPARGRRDIHPLLRSAVAMALIVS